MFSLAPPPLPPRHALPLFTSLLNVVCAYDPVGYGFPYNYLLTSDQREQLVVQVIQVLAVTLEHEGGGVSRAALQGDGGTAAAGEQEVRRRRSALVPVGRLGDRHDSISCCSGE